MYFCCLLNSHDSIGWANNTHDDVIYWKSTFRPRLSGYIYNSLLLSCCFRRLFFKFQCFGNTFCTFNSPLIKSETRRIYKDAGLDPFIDQSWNCCACESTCSIVSWGTVRFLLREARVIIKISLPKATLYMFNSTYPWRYHITSDVQG